MCGLKFRRQSCIGRYIVDFVCFEIKLIIELDGSQHMQNKIYDNERDIWLASQGFKILRFWNSDLNTNRDGVLETIRSCCESHPPLTPPIKGREPDTNNF